MNLNADYYMMDMPLNPHNDARALCTLHVAVQINRFSRVIRHCVILM